MRPKRPPTFQSYYRPDPLLSTLGKSRTSFLVMSRVHIQTYRGPLSLTCHVFIFRPTELVLETGTPFHRNLRPSLDLYTASYTVSPLAAALLLLVSVAAVASPEK
ncbi:hypothetical protein J6590_043533 [Homalodisca vitripennis]|nr:hypothetical protein J6590_043533 [Homalodisca vitripennis]